MFIKTIITVALIFTSAAVVAETMPAAPQSSLPASTEPKLATKNQPQKSNQQSAVITLGSITTEVEGDLTIVTARLNKSPEWKSLDIEEHGTFLQIKLPQTQIPASGEFADGSGPFLRKLASFQLGNDDGALRLFLSQDAAKAKSATSAELLGDRIVVTIDHKKLEQLVSPNATDLAVSQKSADAPVAAASTTVPGTDGQSAAPAVVASSDKNSSTTTSASSSNFHAQLTKAAAASAVLFVLFLGVQFFRTKQRRSKSNGKHSGHIDPVTMRVLSSIPVGQKQKLTLVQVGDQQLLLGVSSDSINLLTNISSQTMVYPFSKALETANPDADVRLKNPAELGSPSSRKTLPTPAVKSRSVGPSRGGSINIGVGENGPVDMKPSSKSEDDITKILRDRLRNLPPG